MANSPTVPTEEQFQTQVIHLAHLYGWRVAHFRPARTADGGWRTPVQADGAGFPDLVLARVPRLIFAELKSENGRVSQAQRDWLDALKGCAEMAVFVEAYVWRPADFDLVHAALKRPR